MPPQSPFCSALLRSCSRTSTWVTNGPWCKCCWLLRHASKARQLLLTQQWHVTVLLHNPMLLITRLCAHSTCQSTSAVTRALVSVKELAFVYDLQSWEASKLSHLLVLAALEDAQLVAGVRIIVQHAHRAERRARQP